MERANKLPSCYSVRWKVGTWNIEVSVLTHSGVCCSQGFVSVPYQASPHLCQLSYVGNDSEVAVLWQDVPLCESIDSRCVVSPADVPRVEGDKRELVVLWQYVLLCESVKAIDSIAERARVADLVPSQGGQAGCRGTSANCNAAVLEWFDLLHKAVMGVLTGFTRTLSR